MRSKLFFPVLIIVLIAVLIVVGVVLFPSYNLSWNYDDYRKMTDMGGVQIGSSSFYYDFGYATEKLQPTANLGKDASFDIALAKNEWEGFQLFVYSKDVDGTLRIEVDDFKNGQGDTLEVSVYQEHYLSVKNVATYFYKPQGSNYYSDLYPDALMPYGGEEVSLKANYLQAFYIETKSPEDARSGDYTASYRIYDEEGEILDGSLQAYVYDFVLPETSSMDTTIGTWGTVYDVSHPVGSEAYNQVYEYLVSRRLSPFHLPCDILSDEADAYMSDPRVSTFIIPYPDDDDLLIAYYTKVSSNPEWAKKGYFYPIDEPHSSSGVRRYYEIVERLQRLCPGYNLVTPFFGVEVTDEENPKGEKIKNFDVQTGNSNISCPESVCFSTEGFYEATMERVADGDRSWWYVCCGPSDKDGYCNMFRYQQGLQHRILFWQQRQYDVTGFLYWDVTYWDYCLNPWENAITYEVSTFAGDGCWLYPGEEIGQDGIVGSLRVVNVTAGLEDYEYFVLAEEIMGEAWVEEQIAKVTTDLTHYTEDPACLELVRRTFANAIEQQGE